MITEPCPGKGFVPGDGRRRPAPPPIASAGGDRPCRLAPTSLRSRVKRCTVDDRASGVDARTAFDRLRDEERCGASHVEPAARMFRFLQLISAPARPPTGRACACADRRYGMMIRTLRAPASALLLAGSVLPVSIAQAQRPGQTAQAVAG